MWFLILLVLICLLWCGLYLLGALSLARAPRLHEMVEPNPQRASWPSLSVVIAACNEASDLEQALRSLQAQDYPALQIILVNDRSTDDTGLIAEKLAQQDLRLRVVHVQKLPEGWLGKVNALRCGLDVSDSELVLFTDADVCFAPGALRRSVQYLQQQALDHLTLCPGFEPRGFGQRAFTQAFFTGFALRMRAASDPQKVQLPFGMGAFNLFRRAALEKTAGLDWLRMDVLDDLALGTLLKDSGARVAVALGDQDLHLAWYESVPMAIRALRKNVFGALAMYKFWLAALILIFMPLVSVAPFILLLMPAPAWMDFTAYAALLSLGIEALVARRRFGFSFLTGLCVPLMNFVLLAALLLGLYDGLRHGGIFWRGTFYPLQALREGRRVRFP